MCMSQQNICMVIRLHQLWLFVKLQMPNLISKYQISKYYHSRFKHTHQQIVAQRSQQINANQVHEPNWMLLIASRCIKNSLIRTFNTWNFSFLNQWQRKAMPWLPKVLWACVFKRQISHVFHVFLWILPTASEIHHLFVIWLISGHNSSIIPAPNKKQYKFDKSFDILLWTAYNSTEFNLPLGCPYNLNFNN